MNREIRVGDNIWVEQAWEDEAGNYHDEHAEVLEIKDGKMRLKFMRDDLTKFLDGADFDVKDYQNQILPCVCSADENYCCQSGECEFVLNYCMHCSAKLPQWEAVKDSQLTEKGEEFWRVRWSKKHPKHGYFYAAHYGGNGSSMNRSMAESTAERWNEEKKPPFI
jgi:hypothetical protein